MIWCVWWVIYYFKWVTLNSVFERMEGKSSNAFNIENYENWICIKKNFWPTHPWRTNIIFDTAQGRKAALKERFWNLILYSNESSNSAAGKYKYLLNAN